ncbi:SdiA-regulated domain-containing protein [Pedobacter sp. AW1-32]|uniref:SdiA-regulated domain-containing protein n=1 Tax=Pedobacter sp. AW1-32 TaxID=3383026 RepID=UPI003FED41D5
MKNIKINIYKAVFVVCVASAISGCIDRGSGGKNVEENTNADFPYDLEHPVKYDMPQSLFEISGIAFQNGNPKETFAIQDEDGDLFHFGLKDENAAFTKFGPKGDYEDLAIIKDRILVLKSNGDIFMFPVKDIGEEKTENVVKIKDLLPKAEYEGIAADDKNNKIYVLTKERKEDIKAERTRIYAFDFTVDDELVPAGEIDLSSKEIARLSGDSKLKFRPSALTKNTRTKEWYILSSINKLLVVANADFKVKGVYPLTAAHFNQPEGIAFDSDNHLYISNEGGTLSAGNVLMFSAK